MRGILPSLSRGAERFDVRFGSLLVRTTELINERTVQDKLFVALGNFPFRRFYREERDVAVLRLGLRYQCSPAFIANQVGLPPSVLVPSNPEGEMDVPFFATHYAQTFNCILHIFLRCLPPTFRGRAEKICACKPEYTLSMCI